MHTITFECETITPMFMAGADGKTPELRAPSIKGALRFWWRALNGHLKLEELKKREGEIFGNTEQRSKVLLRVRDRNTSFIPVKELKKLNLNYFYYTYIHHDSNRSKSLYGENSTFDIVLRSSKEDALEQAVRAFWLLTYLGGLGSRSRRGLGAFTVLSVKGSEKLLDRWKVSFQQQELDLSTISNWIQGAKRTQDESNFKKYSTLEGATVYFSSRGCRDYVDSLGELEDIMTDFRVHSDFTLDTLDEKAAFGLPISVRYPHSKPLSLNLKNHDRRASPLVISVYKGTDNLFRWTLTHLAGVFMPENDKIELKKGNNIFKGKVWSKENTALLNEFLAEVRALSINEKI